MFPKKGEVPITQPERLHLAHKCLYLLVLQSSCFLSSFRDTGGGFHTNSAAVGCYYLFNKQTNNKIAQTWKIELWPQKASDKRKNPLLHSVETQQRWILWLFTQEWSRLWRMPPLSLKFSKAQWVTREHLKMKSWITGSRKNALLKRRWVLALPSPPRAQSSIQLVFRLIVVTSGLDRHFRWMSLGLLLKQRWFQGFFPDDTAYLWHRVPSSRPRKHLLQFWLPFKLCIEFVSLK